jgi:nucleosome-remodeling factor subunit BPTF
MQAVASSSNAGKDFARALTVLVCCIKPCILLPVWTDSLGHTMVRRTGQLGKEEKKRSDKRDKKEREEEDERLKPWMTWVSKRR